MAIWAVTGGIACGKSAVIHLFKLLGVTCYSADDDARDVLSEPDIQHDVHAAFPDAVDNSGHIDRAKLGRLIFADPGRRTRLGQIMHPRIRERIKARIDQNHASAHIIPELYEVPLLFEGGLETWFDGTICVICNPDIQKQRLVDRHFNRYQSMLSDEDVDKVIASQLPVADKAGKADIVIDNSGTNDDLIQRVAAVYDQLCIRGKP